MEHSKKVESVREADGAGQQALEVPQYMHAFIARDVKQIKLALDYLIQLNQMNLAALNHRPPPVSNRHADSSKSEVSTPLIHQNLHCF